MFQTKEQGKLQKGFDEIDICNLPDKEFKVIVICTLREIWRRMEKQEMSTGTLKTKEKTSQS